MKRNTKYNWRCNSLYSNRNRLQNTKKVKPTCNHTKVQSFLTLISKLSPQICCSILIFSSQSFDNWLYPAKCFYSFIYTFKFKWKWTQIQELQRRERVTLIDGARFANQKKVKGFPDSLDNTVDSWELLLPGNVLKIGLNASGLAWNWVGIKSKGSC